MEETQQKPIGPALVMAMIVFVCFHAMPVTAMAEDSGILSRVQEQKIEQQESMQLRFELLVAKARAQHAQIRRWHQARDKARKLSAKVTQRREMVHLAKDSPH
jgi:hypothetical protein